MLEANPQAARREDPNASTQRKRNILEKAVVCRRGGKKNVVQVRWGGRAFCCMADRKRGRLTFAGEGVEKTESETE